jgi:hypothetical protein
MIFCMGTAGPRKTVRQPADSASRRKLDIPATCTHSPMAAATTVLGIAPSLIVMPEDIRAKGLERPKTEKVEYSGS